MKAMKGVLKNNFSVFLAIFLLLAGTLFFCSLGAQSASAETFSGQSVSDDNFTVMMRANGRRNALQRDERTYNVHGKDITYYCFRWRDLESLSFFFSSRIQNKKVQFSSYSFDVAFLQTDNLSLSFGTEEEEKQNLFTGNIANNTFSQPNFYYYVDSNRTDNPTSSRANGKDFGLYRFTFSYTLFDESTMQAPSTIALEPLYVSVMPDDINSIPSTQDIKIVYSISSSKKLLNAFNFSLSNDSFRYVKPELIEWQVTGIGKDKRYYCLNKKMKEENMIYANYTALWDSTESVNGTSFLFDSNDVEGTWDVVCIIRNPDGVTEKMRLTLSDLSTIKAPSPSYLWLILLIIGILIVLAVVISLIVVIKHKKHEKVW